MWTRVALFLLLFNCLAAAETAFTGLATNTNGSKLWFSSRLRLRGTDQFAHAKIFTWDAALAAASDPMLGFRLLEQREARMSFPPGDGVLPGGTFHELVNASVSRDGAIIALTGLNACINFTLCTQSQGRFEATIYGVGSEPRKEPEEAILSANGQFAVLRTSGVFPQTRILNLATGVSTPQFDRSGGILRTANQIANNGAAIQDDGLRLWPTGEHRPLPAENCRAINADATLAFCDPSDGNRLEMLDIDSGGLATLFTFQEGGLHFFDISESGDEVVVLDETGLWLVRSDRTELRLLVEPETGIAEFVLSGDGNVVFVSTTDSRLLRIDIGAASAVELLPATRAIRLDVPPNHVVKGSVYEYRSGSIPQVSEVRLPGGPAPAFHSGPELVSFHVPFDAPNATGWPELVLASQPDGPFVSSVLPGPVQVVDFSPFWYTQGGPPGSFFFALAALHEDFRGVVTPSDPAVPGEIIHAYGGGFGPVDPVPPTGQAAGANPLSRVLQQPFECTFYTGAPSEVQVADILYAGLAPGWIGLYQLDVRLPDIPPPSDPDRFPRLQCGIPNSTSANGWVPYGPRGE